MKGTQKPFHGEELPEPGNMHMQCVQTFWKWFCTLVMNGPKTTGVFQTCKRVVSEGLFSSPAPGEVKIAEMLSEQIISAAYDPVGQAAIAATATKKNHCLAVNIVMDFVRLWGGLYVWLFGFFQLSIIPWSSLFL